MDFEVMAFGISSALCAEISSAHKYYYHYNHANNIVVEQDQEEERTPLPQTVLLERRRRSNMSSNATTNHPTAPNIMSSISIISSTNNTSTTNITNTSTNKLTDPCTHPQQSTRMPPSPDSKKKRVTFDTNDAQIHHILTLPHLSCMSKSHFWWQQKDYVEFKKTRRILVKPTFQEGRHASLSARDEEEQDDDDDPSSNEFSEFFETFENVKESPILDDDKWWCAFGHSRRGIEKMVSIREGRERHSFAHISVHSVLDEQLRQTITNEKDIQKIANVSRKYTQWAKDLALAAGAADADAVRSDFDPSNKNKTAKTREEHLSMILSTRNSSHEDDDLYSSQFILDIYSTHGTAYGSIGLDDDAEFDSISSTTTISSSSTAEDISNLRWSSKLTAEALKERDLLWGH